MIDRYDPTQRGLSLRQLMDRLIEDAFVMPGQSGGPGSGMGSLAMDVYEEGNTLVVEAQLPGLKPEEIDVTVERGVLRAATTPGHGLVFATDRLKELDPA